MEDLKELTERLNEETKVSRRGFLQGLGAMGATAAIYGCANPTESNVTIGLKGLGDLEVPEITEKTVWGAAPHNCGGRCPTKAFVKSGVIKRFVTDERPDKNFAGIKTPDNFMGDNPQRRACWRCRSYKGRLYRSDRLLYPLKQTKERGDLSGFVRISWDQAFTEIAAKMQEIKEANKGKTYKKIDGSQGITTGNEVFIDLYATGDGSVHSATGSAARLLNLFGGYIPFRNDYSFPSIEHASSFSLGQNMYYPLCNSRDDIMNAELVILWSNDYSALRWGTNSMWYITQAKERGAEIISVDSRLNDTVATQADEWLPVVPGTDPALLLSMMYVMITEGLLDSDFVKKYVHGFFDDPNPSHYHPDDANNPLSTKYIVPRGASLAAYIMGNDISQVHKNYAGDIQASIYPENIYYNVKANDPLHGKPVPCYGQTPKTPEWAEKITGVKADAIRGVARKWATKKTTTYIGAGFQRYTEGEQPPWLIYIMGAITGNFGEHGRSMAISHDKTNVAYTGLPRGSNSVASAATSYLYDISKLTAPTYTPNYTRNSFPVFLWADAVERGENGGSRWNDAQIERLAMPIKVIFNFAGNILLNQDGDCNQKVRDILANSAGKLELIVTTEHCMTASAKYSDYVLPAAMAWEKDAACTTWVVGDNVIRMNKAVEPPGECITDYDICAGIAEKLGIGTNFTEGKTIEDRVRESWEASPYSKDSAKGVYADGKMTYEEWNERGIYVTADENTPSYIEFKGFRNNPAASPLGTPSGKVEAYSQALVEDYVARGYNNIDGQGGQILIGPLHDGSNSTRFVYPIPMYIPSVEIRHADGSHPDPLGANAKGYQFQLISFHLRYRSHSTHNENAYQNELYKGDGTKDRSPYHDLYNGANPFYSGTFIDPNRAGHDEKWKGNVWVDGVYEPVWINPADASKLGIKDGNRVLISNDRGKVYAIAQVTKRTYPGVLCLGQGAWYSGDGNVDTIDIGGCVNTLMDRRPTRIGQCMAIVSAFVKIEKA